MPNKLTMAEARIIALLAPKEADKLRDAERERERRIAGAEEALDVPAGSAVGFLALLAGVVESERLVVAGLSPEMPCRKMHENRHRAFREALSMATAYFLPNIPVRDGEDRASHSPAT